MKTNDIPMLPESRLAKFFFADRRMAWLWLVVRLYVGWQWLSAGYEKVISPVWVVPHAGFALKGFFMGALKQTAGAHPNVSHWYALFLKGFALHHVVGFSYMVSFGELLVGIGLILGAFTGVAAFFGAFMNLNYLFSGTISTNPMLLVLEFLLIVSWRIVGWIGLDRYLLPLLMSRKSSRKK